MEPECAITLSYEETRKMYKSHLESINLNRNTIATILSDTFYLWNNESKECFWKIVTTSDFETEAKEALLRVLMANSSGNVSSLIDGYVSNLRRFRDFILGKERTVIEKDDATALKEFLVDIECLAPLSEWTSQFNMFDVLRISRVEIRHSNMLSWLLNPNENHGLGDSVLRGFVQFVVTSFSDDKDIFDVLLMDFHDFSVQREWRNIDVLITSNSEKFVLCIENKIDSKEHDDQLNRYRQDIEDVYSDYKKMYIYLSPKGTESSDPDNWCSMSYADVLSIVESAKNKVKLLPDAQLLIDNYIEIIRRSIVGDERLAQICAEIYAKHQKALDLIYENRPDRALELAEIIHAWAANMSANGEIEYVPSKSAKTYTRFKTKTMSSILPDALEPKSGWGTNNYYFYEIVNNEGRELYIQFSVSAKDIPADLKATCEHINKVFPSRVQKENWQWRTHFVSKKSKFDAELLDDKIFESLNKRLLEVKAFEVKLEAALKSN